MTISTQSSTITVAGNGANTSFTFPFIADSASNISVQYQSANGTITTLLPSQYKLIINPALSNQLWGVGGIVTYPLTGSPIASGTYLIISRILPLTQSTSISNQGNFFPAVIEAAIDTLCMEIQQVSARGGAYRGIWGTGITYNYGDIVQDGVNGIYTNNIYVCSNANVSSTWSADLASGDWNLIFNVQTLSTGGLPLSGGTIAGNLAVSGTSTLANASPSSVTSTGSTTPRTLADRGADVFNVKDYGAKGDGTTDDSTAINAAIAAAHAAGGGTVFFPSSSGNYYTNVTPITLYGGVALKGSGRFGTVLQGNTTTPASAVIITSSGGFDAEISDLQVQSWGNAGVYIKGVGRSHIHGVRVYHGNAGVGQSIVYDTNSVAGAYNHILDNSDLERGNIGVWVKSSAWSLSVHDNKIISDAAFQIDGTGGGSVYENNLIQSYTSAPTGIMAVYTGASANDVWKGNYIQGYVDAWSFSSTNFGMELICNHYDTVTTKYVDHTSNGTAISIEIDETGYVCIGGSKGGVGVQGAGQFGIIGNSANNAVGYRTVDTNTGGGQWSWLNGAKAAGHMSLRNDVNGHYPIDVSGDNTTFLGTVTVANAINISGGTGTPSGSLSGNKGDLYSRTNGAVGSTLYVCQGGTTWNAVAGV